MLGPTISDTLCLAVRRDPTLPLPLMVGCTPCSMVPIGELRRTDVRQICKSRTLFDMDTACIYAHEGMGTL